MRTLLEIDKKSVKSVHQDINNILEVLRTSVNAKAFLDNTTIGEQLGFGAEGIAYLLSNGKVLKLTKTDEEAASSNIIKHHPHKNIVKIDKVCLFIPKKIDPLYMIIEERLQSGAEVDNKIHMILTSMTKVSDAEIGERLLMFHYNDQNDINKAKENVKQKYDDSEEAIKFIDDILSAVKHMRNLGIQWYDLYGNVGVRNKDFVIYDLGHSSSPGVPDETIVHEIKKNN